MENETTVKNPLRILHLEDSPLDAEIIRERLMGAGFSFQLDLARNERQFIAFLQSGGYDLILADYHLPAFEGEEALRLSKLHCPDVPFICVSGAIGEVKAVELLKQGATDYVAKTMLDKLAMTMIQAVDETRERSEHRLAEEALRIIENRQAKMIANISDVIVIIDKDGINRYKSPNVEKWFGWKPEELVGASAWDNVHPDDLARTQKFLGALANEPGATGTTECRYRCKDSSYKWIEISLINLLADPDILGILGDYHDINERKKAEEEKVKLEAQLHQAQKVESVGRLAGGVAHDFNNMLSVIIGHAEISLMRMDPSQPLYASLTEISKAAQRSADLTRQLLAFARKQTVSPKVIDLNEIVAGMLNMLQRLIGENMHLSWKPGTNLWPVMMDSSQIDQIMANLCVNARDAISDVGEIIIETGDCSIDENYCKAHPYASPGEYVKIVVSDNGKGMDRETLGHIFEPFFTTKGVGEGTGLGLATVYGIVRQNNGFINVYSEPGTGTTFTIYLPRHEGEAEEFQKEAAAEIWRRGQETILLVEDELAILEMTTMILRELGYTVLQANSPAEAIRKAREHSGEIHLLMTDVIMPEMNGKDLANNLLTIYPKLKRLFMSGYTEDIIAHHGVLDEGIYFIQKPFQLNYLATKLREVLEGCG